MIADRRWMVSGVRFRGGKGRRAFSLAELMIAIVILGLGLLFIAAALPVGIEYSRRSVTQADAAAAATYALDAATLYTATSRTLDNGGAVRRDRIFRPRDPNSTPPRQPDDNWEPIIKVRPLTMRNVQMVGSKKDGAKVRAAAQVVDACEEVVTRYLNSAFGIAPTSQESDAVSQDLVLYANPIAPATARVFPPVHGVDFTDPVDFIANALGNRPAAYATSPLAVRPPEAFEFGVDTAVLRKAMERRIAWTAFYRRVRYPRYRDADVTDDHKLGSLDDDMIPSSGDPLLYELIVVITQRPTPDHRFPAQRIPPGARPASFSAPKAVRVGRDPIGGVPSRTPNGKQVVLGTDRLAPMPWLVTFEALPPLPGAVWSTSYRDQLYFSPASRNGKPVTDSPTLIFRCSNELGRVLPVGSVLVPARNDYRPNHFLGPNGLTEWAGFVPSAPDELPIYRVIRRPDANTVVVENNGFYPWVARFLGATMANGPANEFPFWIIPPPFTERANDRDRTPVYENESPVIKVVRKVIRLPEMP